jgi:hypothetical protein
MCFTLNTHCFAHMAFEIGIKSRILLTNNFPRSLPFQFRLLLIAVRLHELYRGRLLISQEIPYAVISHILLECRDGYWIHFREHIKFVMLLLINLTRVWGNWKQDTCTHAKNECVIVNILIDGAIKKFMTCMWSEFNAQILGDARKCCGRMNFRSTF